MPKEYAQELHAIFNGVLTDPSIPPNAVIMEAMDRARLRGMAQEAALWELAAESQRLKLD